MSLYEWKALVEKLLKSSRLYESSHTDFLLVYKDDVNNTLAMYQREEFFKWMTDLKVNVRKTQWKDATLVELNIPLYLLCYEANKDGIKAVTQYSSGFMDLMAENTCNFLSWGFQGEDISDCDNLTIFLDQKTIRVMRFIHPSIFISSTRSLLAYYILNSSDLILHSYLDTEELGLNIMLNKKQFLEAFPLHDVEGVKVSVMTERARDSVLTEGSEEDQEVIIETDLRSQLYKAWKRFFKYQPVHMIRNYFGTHIALYFAWCDVLILSLWIPMIFGIITFIYGIIKDITESRASSNSSNETSVGNYSSSSIFRNAFDNELMPPYAIVVTLWGTLFLELWKRENSKLAYLWDVKSLEDIEPDRPQYIDISQRKSIINFYLMRWTVSFIVTLFMVVIIMLITAVLIVYRVIIFVDFCSEASLRCFMLSEGVATILNSIGIIFLGKIYRNMAYKLTEWENYRTQTEFTDALIIKLFAFEFANSYAACFYIAFFRRSYANGIFGIGPQYNDVCESSEVRSCMPLLSFQILFLMILTPIPKLFSDFLVPLFKRKVMKKNKVAEEIPKDVSHIVSEYNKEPLKDFTISEYSEKVVLYGYLMLFAASFPLAPLMAMLALVADIRIDCHRLLYFYRKPVAFVSQDIGMWYDILNFINVVGVLVNACLIAFTSRWGEQLSATNKLVFVLFFENVVFAMKYLIAIIIPDIPKTVKKAKKMDAIKSGRMFSVRYNKGYG